MSAYCKVIHQRATQAYNYGADLYHQANERLPHASELIRRVASAAFGSYTLQSIACLIAVRCNPHLFCAAGVVCAFWSDEASAKIDKIMAKIWSKWNEYEFKWVHIPVITALALGALLLKPNLVCIYSMYMGAKISISIFGSAGGNPETAAADASC